MNRFRRGALAAALLCAGCWPLSGQKLAMAVMEFTPTSRITGEDTAAMTEMVRAGLVATGVFSIVETQQVELLVAEQELQLSGIIDDARLKELGALLHADYLLIGSSGRIEDRIYVTSRLISARSGLTLFGASLQSSDEHIFGDLESYVRSLATVAIELTVGATLENVRRLIEQENWPEASARLYASIERYGPSGEAAALREEIEKGWAQESYEQARSALKAEEYQKAREEADRMIRLAGATETYRDLYGTVELQYKEDLVRKRQSAVKQTERQIRRGNPEAGMETLAELNEQQSTQALDQQTAELLQRAERRLAGKELKQARRLMNASKFTEAAETANHALALDPGRERCAELIQTIHEKRERSERQLLAKIDLGPWHTPGSRRRFYASVNPALANYSSRDADASVSGTFQGAGAGLKLYERIQAPLHGLLSADLVTTWGSSTRNSLGISRESSLWSAELQAGAGLTGAFSRFDVGLGLQLIAGIVHSEIAASTFLPQDQVRTGLSVGFGWHFRCLWYFSERLAAGLRFASDSIAILGQERMARSALGLELCLGL